MTLTQREKGPLVHLNESSADSLFNSYVAAAEAVAVAQDLVAATAPHPRDYYPLGEGAHEKARAAHEDRLRKLQEVFDELAAIAVRVEAQR